jgi:hypothetical protein
MPDSPHRVRGRGLANHRLFPTPLESVAHAAITLARTALESAVEVRKTIQRRTAHSTR